MALTETMSNTWKRMLLEQSSGDDFTMSLMKSSFVFDKDVHATYNDISGHELAAGGGYTGSGESMTVSGEVLVDNNNDRARFKFLDVAFEPTSGEDFGPTAAATVRDRSLSGEQVVGCVEFGTSYQISGEFLVEGFTVEIN